MQILKTRKRLFGIKLSSTCSRLLEIIIVNNVVILDQFQLLEKCENVKVL